MSPPAAALRSAAARVLAHVDYAIELAREIRRRGFSLAIETSGFGPQEGLRTLAEQGVELLTCGTCLNFYGLTDKLAVGGVTNMYEIVEKQMKATLVVRP